MKKLCGKTAASIFLAAIVLLHFAIQLEAQEPRVEPEPQAQNRWESIYWRIASSPSWFSVLELLKGMDLEADQGSLAASYAVILQDQIRKYVVHRASSSIYTEEVLVFLLNKVGQLADTVAVQNPETANVIGLTLIPDLEYGPIMGKADYALGKLQAEQFAQGILERLEDINNLLSVNPQAQSLALHYSAAGGLAALEVFQLAESYPLLFLIYNGPFDTIVRNQAQRLMDSLYKDQAAEVQAQFMTFIEDTQSLQQLHTVANQLLTGTLPFDDVTIEEMELALLTRLNTSSWLPTATSNVADGQRQNILYKIIIGILSREQTGAEGLQDQVVEQLEQSYANTAQIDAKLLALQAMGKLGRKSGLQFLYSEILRLNFMQRTNFLSYTDEIILRQLLHALQLSGDHSAQTVAVLQDVTLTPYALEIRQIAKNLMTQAAK